MQVRRAAVTDAAELERAVDAFAQQPNGAYQTSSQFSIVISLLRWRLGIACRAVYPYVPGRAAARRADGLKARDVEFHS